MSPLLGERRKVVELVTKRKKEKTRKEKDLTSKKEKRSTVSQRDT